MTADKRERLVALIAQRRQAEARAAINEARLREHLGPFEGDPLEGSQVAEAVAADVARLPEATVDHLISKYTPPGFVW